MLKEALRLSVLILVAVVLSALAQSHQFAALDVANTFTATQIVQGILDGQSPVTVTTSTPVTVGGTYSTGYYFNEDATPGAAITYNLPTAVAGKQYCFSNSYGSAGNTGTLTIQTSASGQFIIWSGVLGATDGYMISAGALGDKGCVVGVDSTHWEFIAQVGTWTQH